MVAQRGSRAGLQEIEPMLPSQSGRPKSSRSHMYRRTRMKRGPVLAFFFIVVFTGTVFGVLKLWPGSKRHNTGPAAADASVLENTSFTKQQPDPPSQPVERPKPQSTNNPSPQISMGSSAKPEPAHNPAQPEPANRNVNEAPATAALPTSSPPPPSPSPNSPPASAAPVQAHVDPQPSATPSAPAAMDTQTRSSSARVTQGFDLLARNNLLAGRKVLSDALRLEKLPHSDAEHVRKTLSELNQKLVFGQEVLDSDTLARNYAVESGDVLAKLPRKLGLNLDWRFLRRINNLSEDGKLRIGQRLKIVTGPFHVVITKSDFRMDLYEGDGDARVYVCSYTVGLGESGATPEGVFGVRPNSKLINPEWVNPHTGQRFEPDDPANPIGERWIGLIGVSDNIRGLSTYGIHGTIDPDSIGKQKSMGCIRMRSEDVEVIYELLMDPVSHIEVHGEDYP
jgi:hypothetical protein